MPTKLTPRGRMDHLSERKIFDLLARSDGHRVSIYLPTHRASGVPQHRAVLENLLRQAGAALTALGERPAIVKRYLQPGHDLLAEEPFWQTLSHGLVLLLSKKDDFHYYRLPIAFKPIAVVGTRYHVKPLLPLLASRQEFYLLALSPRQARLLAATTEDLHLVDAEGMPTGLSAALRYEETALAQPLRLGSGRSAKRFHADGAGGTSEIERIARNFRRIDRCLRPLLQGQTRPLVLAGLPAFQDIYRGANTYPALAEGGIPSSLDNLSDRELHAQAMPIVAPLFRRARQAAAAEFDRLAADGRTTNRLADVVTAAQAGRVDTLFMDPSVDLWGQVLSGLKPVVLHERPQTGDENVLDYVAALTLTSRGTVYAVSDDAMPRRAAGAPASAILRG